MQVALTPLTDEFGFRVTTIDDCLDHDGETRELNQEGFFPLLKQARLLVLERDARQVMPRPQSEEQGGVVQIRDKTRPLSEFSMWHNDPLGEEGYIWLGSDDSSRVGQPATLFGSLANVAQILFGTVPYLFRELGAYTGTREHEPQWDSHQRLDDLYALIVSGRAPISAYKAVQMSLGLAIDMLEEGGEKLIEPVRMWNEDHYSIGSRFHMITYLLRTIADTPESNRFLESSQAGKGVYVHQWGTDEIVVWDANCSLLHRSQLLKDGPPTRSLERGYRIINKAA